MKHARVLMGALALSILLGIAVGAPTTYPATQGVTFQIDNGYTITLGKDMDIQTGNPFLNGKAIKIRNITLYATGDGDATLDTRNASTLSDVDTTGDWLTVNATDDTAENVSVNGQVDLLKIYNQSIDREADGTDLTYDAPSTFDLRVTNTTLSKDETLVAIDTSSDTAIASSQAFANGTVEFENIDSGFHDVNLREGADVLKIFNETKPATLAKDQVTFRLRFFSGDTIIQRSVSDGTASLAGLPQDERIVVTVKEDESDYQYRRIIIESIFEQSQVYVLHDTQPSVGVVFELADKTGKFPATESRLFVEKPIEKDFDGDGTNETKYQTIVGDRFGADGRFPANLVPNERYRLRVVNADGDTRVLGAYSASTGGVIEVPIGDFREQGRGANETSFGASLVEVNGQRVVRLRYNDPANKTRSLDLEVIAVSKGASDLKSNTTIQGPFGTYTETLQLPANAPENATYRIRFHADRDGRPDAGGTRFAGATGSIFGGLGIDPQVLRLLSWVGLVAMTGGVVLIDDRLAAFVAVATASGLTLLGPLSIPAVALGIAGAMAVIYQVTRSRL